MKIGKVFFLSVFLGLVASCGSDKDPESANLKGNYNYNFDENGCKTGNQSFSSIEAYCKGLQNETLNKGCAQNIRKINFELKCPGTFTPFSE
jgi:hypothetical protein